MTTTANIANIDTCRSYATEANLVKALGHLGFADCRHVIVCNRAGRFTAVFVAPDSGYMAQFASEGFLTIG